MKENWIILHDVVWNTNVHFKKYFFKYIPQTAVDSNVDASQNTFWFGDVERIQQVFMWLQ